MTNAELVVGIVVGSLLAACFQANKPLDSTQTGNPPVIDTARVALYLTSGELRVIGEPGAVEPGGVEVEVTNLRTGTSFTTQAAADGSFDVEVAGSETDVYSVRAKSEGRASAPVFVIRGNAAVSDGRDGSLSCEQRNTLAGELLAGAAKTADRSCKVDTDCAAIVAGASCYAPACWFAYVSERGNDEIERVRREIDANLCANYEADACSHPLPKCATPPAAVCVGGQCTSAVATDPGSPASCESLGLGAAKRLEAAIGVADRSCNEISDCILPALSLSCRGDCPVNMAFSLSGLDSLSTFARDIEANECAAFNAMGCGVSEPICPDEIVTVECIDSQCMRTYPTDSCVVCLENEVNWQTLSQKNGRIVDSSRAFPCASYTRYHYDETTGEERRCETPLRACNAITSTGAISTALAHPDVQQILAEPENPVIRGNARERVQFQVMVGKKWIELHGSCDGAPSDCNPVPTGLEKLRELLQQVDHALASDMAPCDGVED
jgi:hypothetical protein